ncbi:hypothetical protein [Pseudomonas purpurea]|uniref:hypothetical protein n=1 Tax=Pseudomonas purpurea TaxID=3136737 RepID=UPI0032633527
MSITVCSVCGESAEKACPVGDFDDLKCPHCGRYSVNRKLIEEMTAMRQRFHILRTQQYLAIHSRSGRVPALDRLEATIHELIVASPRHI